MPFFEPTKYIKDESSDPIYHPVSVKFAARVFGYPILFTVLGVFFLVTQVLLPLIVFTTQDTVWRPVESTVLGVASGFREFEFSELKNTQGTSSQVQQVNIPEFYYITIPKLRIEHAKIESSPENLSPDTALGHYIGSSQPGENGNTFIYGHSVLPSFYNPRNYKTIFSTLHTLLPGDEFTIDYNNKTYTYKVEEKKVLKPEEVDPLAGFKPKYLNESTITLMTCSPPGTKIKRLLVNAVLVN